MDTATGPLTAPSTGSSTSTGPTLISGQSSLAVVVSQSVPVVGTSSILRRTSCARVITSVLPFSEIVIADLKGDVEADGAVAAAGLDASARLTVPRCGPVESPQAVMAIAVAAAPAVTSARRALRR